ncbi:MAG: cadherin domain-containing protein [Planctomycetales bacterium]|nr:cadherin domain-containing protein [Planctomycetales bacterium]
MHSRSDATYTIDFYSVHAGVSTYLGSSATTTNSDNDAAFSAAFAADVALGDTIFATATSSGNSTSELSAGVTATPSTAALLWSTQGSGNGNGASGLESWTAGEVVSLSDPNLDFTGGTHTGTFASLLNLNSMAADSNANVDGIHYVSRDIVIGSGANQLQLQAGDLLLSTANDETLTSLNSLSVTRDDIFVFRPTIAGNYASGTFLMALDNLSAIHGGGDTIGFTLVEQDTAIGVVNPVTLTAGTFLFTRDGTSFSDNIYSFTASDVGAGTTAGAAPTLLINGEDFGINASITGLDLVESSITIGGVTLPTASILLTVDANLGNVGTTNATIRNHDVIQLTFQQTTQGSGTAIATAATIVAGADLNLNGSSEQFDALSIHFSNDGPTITSIADVTVDEDTQSAPITFQISDPDDLASSLTVTATSSDNLLIPSSSFLFQGTNENRTLQFTPAANATGGPVTITITVSDGKSSTSTSFQVSVTPINDVPTANDDTMSIVENSADGTQVGFVSASDPDLGDSLTYTIVGGTGQTAFSVNSTTGRINVANSSLLDFETTTQYTLQVEVHDTSGSVATATITIDVTDANDNLPIITAGQNFSVFENAANGTQLGTVIVSDADANTVLSNWTLVSGNTDGIFAIDASTGEVTVANNTNLDFETTPNYTLVVRVFDGANWSADEAVSISVSNANEGGVSGIADNDATANSVVENLAPGATVGITASAVDPDFGDIVTYSLTDSATGRFVIDANTGVVSTTAALDAETATSYSITVRADSSDGSFSSRTFTIAVQNVNEFAISAITDTDGAANSVAENASIGSLVGIRANAADGDTSDTITYSLDANPAGTFAIDSSTGRVRTAKALDYESANSYTIVVRATSSDGSSSTANFTVAITDVNDNRPVGTSGQTFHVTENSPNGTTVGTIGATDVDTVGSLQNWTIINGNSSGIFAINASSGQLLVADNTSLDYEQAQVHNLGIRVSDGVNQSTVFFVTVYVDNIDDTAPRITPNQAYWVSEAATDGTSVGFVQGVDPDGLGTLQNWQITGGNTSNIFGIDSTTGEITIADRSLLDFETIPAHTLQITVSDGSMSSLPTNVVIHVNNLNEAPTATGLNQSLIYFEDNRLALSSLSVSDADAGDRITITLALTDPHAGRLTTSGTGSYNLLTGIWTITDSVTNVNAALANVYFVPLANSSSDLDIRVLVRDELGAGPAQGLLQLAGQAVNDAPTANTDNFLLTGNSSLTLRQADLLLNDTDIDGDSLTWSLVSGPAHGTFEQQLDGSWLYTPDDGYSGEDTIVYVASDGTTTSNSATVNIQILPFLAPPPPAATVAATTAPAPDPEPPQQSATPTTDATSLPIALPPQPEPESVREDNKRDHNSDEVAPSFNEIMALTAEDESGGRADISNLLVPDHALQVGTSRDGRSRSDMIELKTYEVYYETAAAFPLSARMNEQFGELQNSISHGVNIEQLAPVGLAVGSTFSITYLAWMARGGYLLSSVLAQMPAWNFIDPLPILDLLKDEDDDDLNGEEEHADGGDEVESWMTRDETRKTSRREKQA